MIQTVYDFLFFLAGVFLHMSLLHFFSFYETRHHPMIARAKNPYFASKVWGVIQALCGMMILVFGKYQFGENIPTLCLILGFCFWAVFLGVFAGRRYCNNAENS